jgi:hypothetical protein
MPSPNSSFIITIKPQGTENYTATHHKSFYSLQRNYVTVSCMFLKLYYQTPYHAIKCPDKKKKITVAGD